MSVVPAHGKSQAEAAAAFDRDFVNQVEDFKKQLAELEQRIAPDATPQKGDSIYQEVHAVLEKSQLICRDFEKNHKDDRSLVAQAQEYFRCESDSWMRQSWIGNRARAKPSGFAGDYEMLIKLYNEATPARGLGGYIDLWIMDLPLARAVRGRLKAARSYLLQEIANRGSAVRVLDIASGPCREYRDWPNLGEQSVEVVALDNDPVALEFVQNEVAPAIPGSTVLKPVRYNALRTRSAEATIRKFGKFDIIYSVGLCDYLSDEHLIRLLAAWRDTLEDDGLLYIAFKDTEEYDETPYQWHLDWFFFQRTLGDVLELYRQAGFDMQAMQTTRDETNIIINFITRRDASQISRVDSGTQELRKPHTAQPNATPKVSE